MKKYLFYQLFVNDHVITNNKLTFDYFTKEQTCIY